MEKIKNLFGEFEEEVKDEVVGIGKNKDGSYKRNPMVEVYGELDGVTRCKGCEFLVRKRFAKTYYKCEKRGNVGKSSAVNDHRIKWLACKFFNKKEVE